MFERKTTLSSSESISDFQDGPRVYDICMGVVPLTFPGCPTVDIYRSTNMKLMVGHDKKNVIKVHIIVPVWHIH
jgi:hypothetical protein